MADRLVNKWAAGTSYGPVLSQTDLYLLNTHLELNPILEGKLENHNLQFHLLTGLTAHGDNNIYGKDEPATLPRVTQLIVISHYSPWCTIIKKETGVTIGDVCSTIYKEYVEHEVTDAEFSSLNPRYQEIMKRIAGHNIQSSHPQHAWGQGYYNSPQPQMPERIRRIDWLREKVYFEGLQKDDNYAKQRLGFKAPNVFIMELTQ